MSGLAPLQALNVLFHDIGINMDQSLNPGITDGKTMAYIDLVYAKNPKLGAKLREQNASLYERYGRAELSKRPMTADEVRKYRENYAKVTTKTEVEIASLRSMPDVHQARTSNWQIADKTQNAQLDLMFNPKYQAALLDAQQLGASGNKSTGGDALIQGLKNADKEGWSQEKIESTIDQLQDMGYTIGGIEAAVAK
jgi:hypothetical protein